MRAFLKAFKYSQWHFFLEIWSSIFIWCSLVTCQSKYYNRKAIKAIGFFTDSGHTSEVFLVYWNYQGGLKGHKRPRRRWGKVVLFYCGLCWTNVVRFCWLFFSLFWRFNIILLQASQLLWWRDLERGYKPSFHQSWCEEGVVYYNSWIYLVYQQPLLILL